MARKRMPGPAGRPRRARDERTDKRDITKETTVGALFGQYPWLKDELVKLGDQFKLLDNPLVRGLIQKATLAAVGQKVGMDGDSIVKKITALVLAHKG